MRNPEVRKPVIIERYPTGDPAVCRIVPCEPFKLPSRTYSFDRPIEPKRQQNRRIGRRTSRFPFTGLDRLVKPRKVQALHKTHHNAGAMVARNQSFQIHKVPLRLRPIHRAPLVIE